MKTLTLITVMFFLISCSDSSYNTVDINSIDDKDLFLEEPTDIVASNGTYNDYIAVYWTHFTDSSITYKVYRGTVGDSGFSLIADNYKSSCYYDTTAVPGVSYNYKIKANSLVYGLSGFSKTVSGFRGGMAEDAFENDNFSSSPSVITAGETQTRSIYPENDVDYIKISGSKGDVYYVSFDFSSEGALDFYNVSGISGISMTDKNDKSAGFLYPFTTTEAPVINVQGSAYGVKTGSYKINAVKITGEYELGLGASANFGSYVKLQWNNVNAAIKYKIYRKTGGGSYENVSVSQNRYQLAAQESVTSCYCYDRSAITGTNYTYKVEAIFDAAETVTLDSKPAAGRTIFLSDDPFESDDDFSSPSDFDISSTSAQNRTVYPMNDKDYISVTLAGGKKYTIESRFIVSDSNAVKLTVMTTDGTIVDYADSTLTGSAVISSIGFADDTECIILVESVNFTGDYMIRILKL